MSGEKQEQATIVNAHPHTVQLSWVPKASQGPEAVAGSVPMNPAVPEIMPIRPGLNYIASADLAKAGGASKLPAGLTAEDPIKMPERYAADLIKASSCAALRQWARDEKRPEVARALRERISELESKRKAA